MQNWDIPKIQITISEEFTCNIEWQWNIPHANHQNGIVTSLIKSVRQALNSVCNTSYAERHPDWETQHSSPAWARNQS